MQKEFPTTSYQDVILRALGIPASTSPEAEDVFKRLGIKVSYVRVARKSVPVVRFDGGVSQWNKFGDADVAIPDCVFDATPILEYVVPADRAAAEKMSARAQAAGYQIDGAALVESIRTGKRDAIEASQRAARARREARELRARQSAVLKTLGYTWQVGYVPTDDEGSEKVFSLVSPSGETIDFADAVAREQL